MWDIGVIIAIVIIGFFVISITHWIYCWNHPKCNGKLPPGSMGLPIIGETFHFFMPNSLYDAPPFIAKRVTRYGPIFRTSIVAQKIVVSLDPEVNHYIIQQEGKLFQCWYTESSSEILGQQNMMEYQGIFHKYLRNLTLNLLSPENLKENMLCVMDKATQNCLCSWALLPSVEVKQATANMVFEYFAKEMMGYDESKTPKKLRDSYNAFMRGFISFPLNIPGTAFHACLQGRKSAIKVIRDIFNERKLSKTKQHDFVDFLLEEVDKADEVLDEDGAVDLIFLLLFASHETVSSAMTVAINFLAENPSVLEELTEEHEAIAKRRGLRSLEVTWEEYKSMTFTHMFINETIRLANIVPVLLRKVIKDVKIKGYTIPAGWQVMISPPTLHVDPIRYQDPLLFNPRRWEGKELHVGSKNFMAFGGGVRLCAGADFAKLQMAIFLHHLVTRYRWRKIAGGDISRRPGLVFPRGLHIQLMDKH
ncbi:hypothetical protein Nepgr_028441 [Nepenthes gracilis]|uniref:Cytochrome P450 n=1 Tax=Nepenthes gracilis TaxID=150966 RepID=A0AAD3TAP3_NEPGR|nr:hypothetical protein Nepgr_028441 [Nepenthes gracilis]